MDSEFFKQAALQKQQEAIGIARKADEVYQTIVAHELSFYDDPRSRKGHGLFRGTRFIAHGMGVRDGLLQAYAILTGEDPESVVKKVEIQRDLEIDRRMRTS